MSSRMRLYDALWVWTGCPAPLLCAVPTFTLYVPFMLLIRTLSLES